MLQKRVKMLLKKRNVDVIFVGLSVLLGVYLNLNTIETLILASFSWVILNPVPIRYPALAAIVFLAATPILLIFKEGVWAEQAAIYSYYFLIMSVGVGIYDSWKNRLE